MSTLNSYGLLCQGQDYKVNLLCGVSEMADYNFTINFKLAPENKVADSLSHFPVESLEYLNQICKIVSGEKVKGMFSGLINQSQIRETWVPVINNISFSADSSEDELSYEEGDKRTKIDIKDPITGQDSEEWIKKIKEIIINSDALVDRRKLPAESRIFLKDYSNSNINKNRFYT